MYNNTETNWSYYISYEGLSCRNSFSQLFMHTWILTLYVAVQENTAMESKHTVLTDIWLILKLFLKENTEFNLRWANPVIVFTEHQNMLGMNKKWQQDLDNLLNYTQSLNRCHNFEVRLQSKKFLNRDCIQYFILAYGDTQNQNMYIGSEYYQPHTYLYIRVHYHRIMEPCRVFSLLTCHLHLILLCIAFLQTCLLHNSPVGKPAGAR